MGYLHINNLYKDQNVLIFKRLYALEKLHGTSANISFTNGTVNLFSGGEKYERFAALFDKQKLKEKFEELGLDKIHVYGEAIGGKQQGMSKTYGPDLKFVVFDIKISDYWLEVPKAAELADKLGLEFVHYEEVSTDMESLNFQRDKDSTQAIRNGMGGGHIQEGVVLRPLIETYTKTGDRIIAKHKRDEFRETKTPREVKPEQFKTLTEAKDVAEEWVTELRLEHVLQKLPQDLGMENVRQVIEAMVEDVYREGAGEIVESKEVTSAIGSRVAKLFKLKLQKDLQERVNEFENGVKQALTRGNMIL